MEFTVGQIAELIGGEVQGDATATINDIGKIEEAGAGCIAFYSNPRYEQYVYTTNATAVIVKDDFVPKKVPKAALIKVKDPYTSFTMLLEQYQSLRLMQKQGIEQPSYISENVEYGDGLYLGAFAYIGKGSCLGNNVKIYPQVYIGDNVMIGDDVVVHSGVRIYAGSKIGHHVNLHSGVVIGSDGFGFAPQEDGSYRTIPQVGTVTIGNHVDIGANTVVDRATMGETLIGNGVKLDNLVQVAHNVQIGDHTVIASQTGIAGSVKIGEKSVIGGQVGIGGHLTLAPRTSIGAQSGIGHSVTTEGNAIMGSPAIPLKDFYRSHAVIKTLPELARKVRELEQKILNLPSATES